MAKNSQSSFGLFAYGKIAALIVGGLLLTTPLRAQQQYSFIDQALLEDAMRGLVAKFIERLASHPVASDDTCHLSLINDRHASRPFDEATQEQVNTALLNAFAEAAHVSQCDLSARELKRGQQLVGLFQELRAEGKDGLVLVVSYYPELNGVMTFAKLQDTDGAFIATSGRYDLPVVPASLETSPGAVAEDVAPSTLRLAGSSVLGQHLMPELAEGFLKHLVAPDDPDSVEVEVVRKTDADIEVTLVGRPDAPIQGFEIDAHSGETGSQALLDETADLAMETRQLDHQMTNAFLDAYGVDMHAPGAEHVIGIDDLEFIVNQQNQLAVVNREVLGEILVNNIRHWNKQPLHGSGLDGEIVVLGFEDDEGENSLMNEAVLHGRGVETDQNVGTAAEMTEAVRANPMAIGHVSKDFRDVNRALEINECGVIYEPDDPASHVEDFEVNTEDHPFARPVYLYSNPAVPNSLRDQFLDYVVSLDKGQAIVRRHFVDLGLHVAGQETTDWRYYTVGDQPAELVQNRDAYRRAIKNARRVSATFRFRNDSFGLVFDSRAERDLEHLVDFLRHERISPDRVMLFGFADSAGPADANAELALHRAEAVADRLKRAGIGVPGGNIHGVGEDAPIACNDLPDGSPDPRGRYKNRRVEVWLRV